MGSSQQFSLRWNNYLRHITSAFDSLRTDLDLVDVTLSCEGKKIKAHKMLLSACSTYFKDLFKENPCQHPVIIFRNVNFSDLEALVDFMYQGEVNVVQEQLASFLTTAELLAVQGLTDGNGQELVDGLDGEVSEPAPVPDVEKPAEKKRPINSSNQFYQLASQNPVSPPLKRKKWNTPSTPSSTQKSSSDINERRRLVQSGVESSSDPVNIIPVMTQVKVEVPEFLDSDSGQIYDNTGQDENPLEGMSRLDHNIPTTSSSSKEEAVDVYGGNSSDGGDISGEQITPAELSQVLAKAGPSSEGSQDSLQALYVVPVASAVFGRGRTLAASDPAQTLLESVVVVDAPARRGGRAGRAAHVCAVCGKSYGHPMSLVQHRKTHSGSTTCPICHKVLNRIHDLKLHMALRHKATP